MKETDQLRKLMESVDTGFAESSTQPDYSKYSDASLFTMLEPGIMPRERRRYWMGQVRKELRKRELLPPRGQKVNEDWGSSDWYPIIKHIETSIDKYGLSPETIQDAANAMADSYYEDMGYDNADDAQQAIIDAWSRMTPRGQGLRAMFGPANESINEEVGTVTDYDLKVEMDADGEEYVTLNVLGTDREVVAMTSDNWIQLANKYIRIHRTR